MKIQKIESFCTREVELTRVTADDVALLVGGGIAPRPEWLEKSAHQASEI